MVGEISLRLNVAKNKPQEQDLKKSTELEHVYFYPASASGNAIAFD